MNDSLKGLKVHLPLSEVYQKSGPGVIVSHYVGHILVEFPNNKLGIYTLAKHKDTMWTEQ